MFFHLLPQLRDLHILFNVFSYLTFRSAGAMATSLLLVFLFGPMTIRWLRALKVGEIVRTDGPETHLKKAGTPTMGGVLIVSVGAISTLLWAQLTNWFVVLTVLSLLWMGVIGFMDDYLKVVRREKKGLIARYKMAGQILFGLGLGSFLLFHPISPVPATWSMVPFFEGWVINWKPITYIIFVTLIVAGSSNAVNLTDGLDGLVAGLSTLAFITLGIFAYLIGRVDTSEYLGLLYLPGAGELAVFAAAMGGACIGFLWFNAHPADVFMGDTGSLALGGALAAMAILLKAEFILPIVGGVFVLEAFSVILQTGWFKFTRRRTGEGRRLILMAPIHHHFEKLGWSETRVVVRFWIVGIFCALVAFSTLKIR